MSRPRVGGRTMGLSRQRRQRPRRDVHAVCAHHLAERWPNTASALSNATVSAWVPPVGVPGTSSCDGKPREESAHQWRPPCSHRADYWAADRPARTRTRRVTCSFNGRRGQRAAEHHQTNADGTRSHVRSCAPERSEQLDARCARHGACSSLYPQHTGTRPSSVPGQRRYCE
jgi:hypothetical protein